MRIALLAAAAVIAGAALTACSNLGQTNDEPVELSQHDSEAADAIVEPAWTCVYAPTYNDDWHDDVICSNGGNSVRPILREWDDFVTEDEMMASAREYEAELNAAM